ncbi:MAG TPA: GNAT family protein [Pyrinomonadaceae bacterium]|nr:GNAT family protein [Pyrinomonadaceae bacterium]
MIVHKRAAPVERLEFLVSMIIEPITLTGELVRLEPMTMSHLDHLAAIATETSIWKYAPEKVDDREKMGRYIDQALKEQVSGKSLPFITKLSETGEIVGSTRFGNIDPSYLKAEIGWTWIAPKWQRSFVNTEAKFLMLAHAFEVWKCIRVEFKTDATNLRSRNAILRLGAVEEGTLRQHMITETGRFRDSVYFSILDKEWTSVKERLQDKLWKN